MYLLAAANRLACRPAGPPSSPHRSLLRLACPILSARASVPHRLPFPRRTFSRHPARPAAPRRALQESERLRHEVDELRDTMFSKSFKPPSAWAEREVKYKMEKKDWEERSKVGGGRGGAGR